MLSILFPAAIGGLCGSLITEFIAFYVGKKNRTQAYYGGLIKILTDHNWNRLKEQIPSGLPVTDQNEKISILCYQHINMLLYAWLHREIVEKDGTMNGWSRWAEGIVQGANLQGNEQYCSSYREILGHGDLYPEAFISWLGKEMGMSANKFTGAAARRNPAAAAQPGA